LPADARFQHRFTDLTAVPLVGSFLVVERWSFSTTKNKLDEKHADEISQPCDYTENNAFHTGDKKTLP
jgi:hypothetical protein